jgi:hypothetical protein
MWRWKTLNTIRSIASSALSGPDKDVLQQKIDSLERVNEQDELLRKNRFEARKKGR